MVSRLLALALLLVATPAAAQEVSAWVEPETVALGQTVDLVVQIEGGVLGGSGEPRLPEIRGVSIVGRSREARVVMSGGRIRRFSVHRYTLLPRAPGAIRIETIRVAVGDKTLTTPTLRLLVVPTEGPPLLGREAGAAPGESPPAVFAVARVDRPRAWVGEQVTLTFAFYHDPSFALAESPDYDPPETPGFWRIEIDQEPVVSLERIGGRDYHVQRFRYALFPLRSGDLEIGPAEVRIVEPDRQRWWEPGRSRSIETESLTIQAEALPPAPPGFAGAVGRFDLGGGVRPRETAAGTPVELELRVQGTGNPSAVGAPVLPEWPDIAVRPPTVAAEADPAPDGVRGEKTFRFLLVPEAPGRLSLGSARLPYFDPGLGDYRVDTLRLGEIVVVPAPAGSPAAVGRGAPRGPVLWPARIPAAPRAAPFSGLADEPWAWAALAGPWASWLLAVGARGALRRRPRDSARAALAELAAARESLARGRVEALPRAEQALEAALAALGEEGVAESLLEAFESARAAIAAARFAGRSPREAVAALARLEALLAGGRPRRSVAMLLVTATALGVATAARAVTPATAPSPDDPVGARAAWQAANDAYRAGDFARAAQGYEALLASWADARLEANLAAAHWRDGREGAALAHYLHALALDPRAAGIRADLARLRADLGEPPDHRGGLAQALGRVTLDELLALLLAANALAFVAFLGSRVRPGIRPLARGAAVLVLLLALAASLHAWVVERPVWAVAVAPAPLLAAPVGAPPVASLAEGSVVRVLERGRAMWRVQAPDRPAGWVARASIVPVDSRSRRH